MSDLADAVERAFQILRDAPMQPHVPLLSPRCGLRGEHDACRSAICECRCHWEALTAILDGYRR